MQEWKEEPLYLGLQVVLNQEYSSGVVEPLEAWQDLLVRGACIQLLMMDWVGALRRGVEHGNNIWKEARIAAKPFWGVLFVVRGTGLVGLKGGEERGRNKDACLRTASRGFD
jgi:hypothetical protein